MGRQLKFETKEICCHLQWSCEPVPDLVKSNVVLMMKVIFFQLIQSLNQEEMVGTTLTIIL